MQATRQIRAAIEPVEYVTIRRETFGSHDQTSHVWAQNKTRHGRSSDGRVFFDDGVIYSHGRHFQMARFTSHVVGGRRLVLVNSDGYSVSTGKHKSHVRGALSGRSDVVQISVPNLGSWTPNQTALDALRDSLIRDIARGGYLHDAKLAWDAFVAIYRPKAVLPGNTGDYVRALDAKIRAKRQAVKLEAAVVLLRTLDPPGQSGWSREKHDYSKPARGVSYSQNRVSDHIESALKDVRSALVTVRATKRYLRETTKGAAYVKTWTAHRNAWIVIEAQEYEEHTRDDRLSKVADFIAAIESSDELPWSFQGEFAEGILRDAVKYGEPVETILKIQGSISRGRLIKEVESRFTYKPWNYATPKVTPEEWRGGKGNANYPSYAYGSQIETMVRRKGDRLETSRGAEAPFAQAVAIYTKASQCAARGRSWSPNGERYKAGHFELDHIEEDGTIRVGCHTITLLEMERLAVREVPHLVKARFPLPVIV